MPHSCRVKIRFSQPPEQLRRYFTAIYLTEVSLPDGETVSDHLLPEWGNLRFHSGTFPQAERRDGVLLSATPFPVTGPTAETLRYTVGTTRMWGVGLQPVGWAKFVSAPAAQLANAVVDGRSHPAFASFRPLAQDIFSGAPDPDAELRTIVEHFLARIEEPIPDEERIVAIHTALIDPDVANVGQLVDRTGISLRTIERLCRRAFGFPPKLLLRRQRFMRSLGQFLIDPSLKWIGAMDGHYHDQAQFVRDFRQFMGMTPREYAALPKPIVAAVMDQRQAYAEAMQMPDALPRAASSG